MIVTNIDLGQESPWKDTSAKSWPVLLAKLPEPDTGQASWESELGPVGALTQLANHR